jgi:NAD(P)H-hydrate repair Nnr-like enzyme with NAD(P)H-hydrate epimerase domain
VIAKRACSDDTAVVIVCGPGNNGGDGLALARRLLAIGVRSTVVLAAPAAKYTGDAGVQLAACRGFGVPIIDGVTHEPPAGAMVCVDALFGTGLSRPIEGRAAELVRSINASRMANKSSRTLAVDVPSGLDADVGRPIGAGSGGGDPVDDADDASADSGGGPAVVRADRTVTLGGMKLGLLEPAALRWTGAVGVGPIGVPRALLKEHAQPLTG